MNAPEFNASQFWSVVASTARNVAAVIIAFGVIWGASWYALQPRIDAYFEEKLSAFRTELEAITTRLTQIQSSLPDPKPFVEIKGGGHLAHHEPVQPGGFLSILYLVRRNSDCPTTVLVQFWSQQANSIASEFNYEVPAQQAAPSFGFQLFPIRVRIPDNIRPGYYSYVPLLIPDRTICPGERSLQVEPSDFFEVKAP